MKKFLILAAALVFILNAPVAAAQSTSIDAILSRIDALILEMELLKRDVEAIRDGGVPSGSVLGASASAVFTQPVAYGETNDDIAKMQKLLATDPAIYPYGVVSGFFGPKTQEAIRNLQTHFGLDPVGVVGPQTTALLQGYLRMYPDENYPADIFDKRPVTPSVLGATTNTPTSNVSLGTNPLLFVDAELYWGEAEVEVRYRDGDRAEFIVVGEDEDEVVERIADRINVNEAFIRAVLSYSDVTNEDDNDYDENDAEDAIDEAEEAIENAEDEINEADDDGEDVGYALDTLDEAEDALHDAEDALDDEEYDDAVEYAEDAIDLAKKAEDRIGKTESDDNEKGDSDEIEHIEADVEEDEAQITVEYEDGSEYEFTVEEDKRDDIIEEVADELDMDEDDVEDLIEFDFGDINSIEVLISGAEATVTIEFESGLVLHLFFDENNENNIIEDIADELDEDEDYIEDVTAFDYN